MLGRSRRKFGIDRLGDPHKVYDDTGARDDMMPAPPS
jgi:hypothetical protein